MGFIDTVSNIKSKARDNRDTSRVINFINLGKGCGTKTTLIATAKELSKDGNRVCILDFDLLSPLIGELLESPVKTDDSLSNYFDSNLEIPDALISLDKKNNLWLISGSLNDEAIRFLDVSLDEVDHLYTTLKTMFDYILVHTKFEPFAEWFIGTLTNLDRGYFIWDNQADNVSLTKRILSYVYDVSSSSGKINNVIVNKRRLHEPFAYETIKDLQCNFITELPYLDDIRIEKNTGEVYVKTKEGFTKGILDVASDIRTFSKKGV